MAPARPGHVSAESRPWRDRLLIISKRQQYSTGIIENHSRGLFQLEDIESAFPELIYQTLFEKLGWSKGDWHADQDGRRDKALFSRMLEEDRSEAKEGVRTVFCGGWANKVEEPLIQREF
ncbi:uncharacterized protein MYCFIDRAFT_171215 [Pseudocercospora fijiensis CIRAD86]|uniref:Uncharacterized protein n=1 Tax=Pseudocercospora fijiensis (strain CIRAD86) TaxID=383855 RepID=M3B7H9_PSEFD|nr:uncharacterized protein MYCFIDRAFT_171215 [Pseudocercospora fijiensis CIRAD86]EME85273.1 hypothetical protein MYCFIDRAFT_171215 [Pseudocercospora fijiensis CIRAD86]